MPPWVTEGDTWTGDGWLLGRAGRVKFKQRSGGDRSETPKSRLEPGRYNVFFTLQCNVGAEITVWESPLTKITGVSSSSFTPSAQMLHLQLPVGPSPPCSPLLSEEPLLPVASPRVTGEGAAGEAAGIVKRGSEGQAG